MYARIYDKVNHRYFKSIVYCAVNQGSFRKYVVIDPDTACYVLVDYLDKTEEGWPPLVKLIRTDHEGWVRYEKAMLLKYRKYCLTHGKAMTVDFLWGYRDVCDNFEFLTALLEGESVPVCESGVCVRDLPDREDWNYIRTPEDAVDFMKKFAGFHDSTLEKLVYENNDSLNDASVNKYDEQATRDIGDDVQFWIKVRPSGSYEGYKTYYISVEDLMDPGLVYNDDLVVHVGNLNGPVIDPSYFEVELLEDETTDKSGFKVSANLKKITYMMDANNDGEQEVHQIDHNTDLIFSYSAELTEDAKVGAQGNWNEAKLIYQNNPYVEIWKDEPGDHPDDDIGETPKDENVVYTFDVTVNKVNAGGQPLSGATFTLYKYNATTFQYDVKKVIESGTDNLTTFVFEGLDEGIYRLEETVPPPHHNAADDIDFHIHAVFDSCDPGHLVGLKAVSATSTEVVLGEATFDPHPDGEPEAEAADPMADHLFTVTLNNTQADLATTVYNYSGTELPSTGGMGTTLIYIAGGVLVLAAIVLLVTKKRMAGNE